MTSTQDRVSDFAEKFGLTLANTAQAALPPTLRALHRTILAGFVDTGAAPTTDQIADQARRLGLDPSQALAELDRVDLVHTDATAVTVAYPFSGIPTRHRVQLDTPDGPGPAVWAMCAADALGIPLMTGQAATITSTDPHSGEPIRIRWRDGAWTWDPSGTVVLVAASPGCATAAEASCRNLNFFTSPEHAQAHLRANPAVTGEVYDQASAIETARILFAALLGHTDPHGELEQFDQAWLAALRQTPFARAIIGLVGLTRLGERPAALERLAAVLDQPVETTAALLRREFTARIEDGWIYWDEPFPGHRTRRTLYVGDRVIPMRSGCAPDLFVYAAVLDVPFRVQETCPVTGTPIQVEFVPGGYQRVDPPEVVTVLLPAARLRDALGGHIEQIDATICDHQPFFASAAAAEATLAARPGTRAFTVPEMFERPWLIHYRDTLRPLIHDVTRTRG